MAFSAEADKLHFRLARVTAVLLVLWGSAILIVARRGCRHAIERFAALDPVGSFDGGQSVSQIVASINRLDLLCSVEATLWVAAGVGLFSVRSWAWGLSVGLLGAGTVNYVWRLFDGFSPLGLQSPLFPEMLQAPMAVGGVIFCVPLLVVLCLPSMRRQFVGRPGIRLLVLGVTILFTLAITLVRLNLGVDVAEWREAALAARAEAVKNAGMPDGQIHRPRTPNP